MCSQELQQLIEDANQTLEETGGCSHEVVVVILHRDTAGGSVGITLAGGADYEAKEITVSIRLLELEKCFEYIKTRIALLLRFMVQY